MSIRPFLEIGFKKSKFFSRIVPLSFEMEEDGSLKANSTCRFFHERFLSHSLLDHMHIHRILAGKKSCKKAPEAYLPIRVFRVLGITKWKPTLPFSFGIPNRTGWRECCGIF